MPLSSQCVSLPLAKRLKELGVPQDSLFTWAEYRNSQHQPEWAWRITDSLYESDYEYYRNPASAFSSGELDRIIAMKTNGKYACVDHEEGSMGYSTEPFLKSRKLKLTDVGLKLSVISGQGILDEKPVDCRAKLLIFLLEQIIITI